MWVACRRSCTYWRVLPYVSDAAHGGGRIAYVEAVELQTPALVLRLCRSLWRYDAVLTNELAATRGLELIAALLAAGRTALDRETLAACLACASTSEVRTGAQAVSSVWADGLWGGGRLRVYIGPDDGGLDECGRVPDALLGLAHLAARAAGRAVRHGDAAARPVGAVAAPRRPQPRLDAPCRYLGPPDS
jgi:hypothetical protein